jgi:hypothetical protein
VEGVKESIGETIHKSISMSWSDVPTDRQGPIWRHRGMIATASSSSEVVRLDRPHISFYFPLRLAIDLLLRTPNPERFRQSASKAAWEVVSADPVDL